MAPARHAGALCWWGAAPSVRGTTVSACECAARARLAHALRPDSQRLAEVRNQTTAFDWRPLYCPPRVQSCFCARAPGVRSCHQCLRALVFARARRTREMAASLPPGWPPREMNTSVMETTLTEDEDDDEHPKCSPCNRYRILVTPMFGMVVGIIGINYAPYVLWTPHATWLSWVALVSPLTLLQTSVIGLAAACVSSSPACASSPPACPSSSPACASPPPASLRLILTSLRLSASPAPAPSSPGDLPRAAPPALRVVPPLCPDRPGHSAAGVARPHRE